VKEIFLNFAKYNEEADKAIIAILNKMTNADREKNRKSYYASLSGLVRHSLGGTVFLLGMLKASVGGNANALKALEPLAKFEHFEGKLDEAQWKKIVSAIKAADKAYIGFISALEEKDFKAPVKLDWYKGKPPTVPVSFMLQNLVVHGTHHRGQISQILDELKIDNDYSGLNAAFLSK
jgi:uncharacterized damage-inducible protein DinB